MTKDFIVGILYHATVVLVCAVVVYLLGVAYASFTTLSLDYIYITEWVPEGRFLYVPLVAFVLWLWYGVV